MDTCIALFRGINVGVNNILLMKELAGILEGLGYVNVQTYIQSGNVVLQSAKPQNQKQAEDIGKRILKIKGFESKVLLIDESAFEKAVANNPFKMDDGKALHFFFLETPPVSPDMELLASIQSRTEDFRLVERVFYLYAPDGIGRSKLAAKVEKALGVPVTARNWNTVSKLLAIVQNLTGKSH